MYYEEGLTIYSYKNYIYISEEEGFGGYKISRYIDNIYNEDIGNRITVFGTNSILLDVGGDDIYNKFQKWVDVEYPQSMVLVVIHTGLDLKFGKPYDIFVSQNNDIIYMMGDSKRWFKHEYTNKIFEYGVGQYYIRYVYLNVFHMYNGMAFKFSDNNTIVCRYMRKSFSDTYKYQQDILSLSPDVMVLFR
jgi:hypothetical protein